jgi:hypothetical protein
MPGQVSKYAILCLYSQNLLIWESGSGRLCIYGYTYRAGDSQTGSLKLWNSGLSPTCGVATSCDNEVPVICRWAPLK